MAELERRRRRPRASTAPASPWVIHDKAAVQVIICAVDTLIEPSHQTAAHPGVRVIRLSELAMRPGEPLQLVSGHRPGQLGQARLGR